MFLYYIKQIDSILPCVCSVIDHRRRQMWLVCRPFVFNQMLTSSVFYEQTHGTFVLWKRFFQYKIQLTAICELCMAMRFSVSGINSLCSLLGLFVLVPLDKPEEFLLQIHKMDHFAERLECWLTRNKFTETLTAIGKAICKSSVTLQGGGYGWHSCCTWVWF